MENIFVYAEIEDNKVADISLELCSKARKLANELGCKVEAFCAGENLNGIEKELFPYGVDVVHVADDKRLSPFRTLPHTAIFAKVLENEKPQICLVGASSIGRDLAPRVASTLKCGLTADCTNLVIGSYTDAKLKKDYDNLLYQIRPAFGGNIIATIVNPETRPQMATVREGVMKKEIVSNDYKGKVKKVKATDILNDSHEAVKIVKQELQARKVNLGAAQVIVAGGFGIGSAEGFAMLKELADTIGGEVAGSRAAVDAGFIGHERQVGQTGVTVRPKLYIAAGISGAIQHRAGMDSSAQIISVNTDPEAPINAIADYTIIGDYAEVLPKMVKYFKQASK